MPLRTGVERHGPAVELAYFPVGGGGPGDQCRPSVDRYAIVLGELLCAMNTPVGERSMVVPEGTAVSGTKVWPPSLLSRFCGLVAGLVAATITRPFPMVTGLLQVSPSVERLPTRATGVDPVIASDEAIQTPWALS